MHKLTRIALTGMLLLSVLALPMGPALAAEDYFEIEEADGGPMIFDLVIVRPIGALATVAGSAAWLLSLPFSALGGNTDQATEKLVKDPFQYTFQRPLGVF